MKSALIHGAILGFSEDFYCVIHGFHWQSSDLAEDLSKSSNRSEDSFHLLCLGVSLTVGTVIAFYTIYLSHWQTEICRWVFNWKLDFQLGHSSEHRLDLDVDLSCVRLSSLISTLFIHSHHEILPYFGVQSSYFLVNPWVNPQIAQISLNPWIYPIDLRIFNFSQFFGIHIHFQIYIHS